MNGELSEFISNIMDPAAKLVESKEVISTEEAAHQLNRFNEELAEGKLDPLRGLVVGSIDATGLYPSLDIPRCCDLAAKKIIKSGLRFKNVDIEWASIYVALEDRGAQAPLILASAEGFRGPLAPFGGLQPLLWGLWPLLEAYGLSQYHQ